MNIVTIKIVTMHFLTCAVLEYIDNLPVLFDINLFNILNDNICLHTCVTALSVKVLGNSNRLPESIKDTINTIRL